MSCNSVCDLPVCLAFANHKNCFGCVKKTGWRFDVGLGCSGKTIGVNWLILNHVLEKNPRTALMLDSKMLVEPFCINAHDRRDVLRIIIVI